MTESVESSFGDSCASFAMVCCCRRQDKVPTGSGLELEMQNLLKRWEDTVLARNNAESSQTLLNVLMIVAALVDALFAYYYGRSYVVTMPQIVIPCMIIPIVRRDAGDFALLRHTGGLTFEPSVALQT
jgi:hypothetical protein